MTKSAKSESSPSPSQVKSSQVRINLSWRHLKSGSTQVSEVKSESSQLKSSYIKSGQVRSRLGQGQMKIKFGEGWVEQRLDQMMVGSDEGQIGCRSG